MTEWKREIMSKGTILYVPIRQCFSIPILGTPCSAHFACIPYSSHLIELIILLGERDMN